jgi:hypothetical protein
MAIMKAATVCTTKADSMLFRNALLAVAVAVAGTCPIVAQQTTVLHHV